MKILRRTLNLQTCSGTNLRISPIQLAINNFYSNPQALNNGDYGHLLQFCSNNHLILNGKQLHARIILLNFTLENFLASKLINFYTKIGLPDNARKVFDEIPQKNTWVYNAMLLAYSCHNKLLETLRLFSCFVRDSNESIKPDNFSLTCVLKALSSLYFDANLPREIHCYALRHGFDSDLFVVNPLITFYARCDEMSMARKVFDLIKGRDIVSWNSMIAGYSHGGYYEECLKLYNTLLEAKNLRPDGVTLASVLQACAQKRDLVQGIDLHKFIIEKNIKMDVLVCNSLIALYAKCGSLDYARELFAKMDEKDEVTYGCLINGYLVHGYVEQALELFREMEKQSLSAWNGLISGLEQNNFRELSIDLVKEMQDWGFRPNSVTVATVLSALSHLCNPKGNKETHAYAIRNDLDFNIYVQTGLIDVYGKTGYLSSARRVFDQSRYRSIMIWTAIISAHATNGEADRALDLFDDMLDHGTRPDDVTFTAVLTACAYLGNTDKAWEILEDMNDRYGIQPLPEHYACIGRVLNLAGNESEAVKFLRFAQAS
ncbi:unnamed protein product [Amaranthus hypochondriacus]